MRRTYQAFVFKYVFIWLPWEQKFQHIKLLLKVGCTRELELSILP